VDDAFINRRVLSTIRRDMKGWPQAGMPGTLSSNPTAKIPVVFCGYCKKRKLIARASRTTRSTVLGGEGKEKLL